ncbi:3-isopropylmalate dehydratase small subunit [Blattabacterium cuenoti]|uniref:3-isopropylmalate dehydratase small subunit n=1 Tax=Blattabacterium cuenoti TaxID=1653831 RepID=UPI00163C923D|nr:3-isopropylmalate dehydratase small subunit [Blattabacterium cuenoti]
MKKFTILTSKIVPLFIEDIDTDQIIPSRFLKETKREKCVKNFFRDWRYNEDGTLKKDCIFNNSIFSGQILLVGRNFGCGSSREHAVWAIIDYGFKAIISSFFADIFKENALNNGLLLVEVSDIFLKTLFNQVKTCPHTNIIINLIKQIILIVETKKYEKFYIHPYRKNCFINGYDDLTFLVSMKQEIKNFEKKRSFFNFLKK